MYDKRPAKTLARARKKTPGHRLSDRDWKLIVATAKTVAKASPDAKLLSFHKRRKRFVWVHPRGVLC